MTYKGMSAVRELEAAILGATIATCLFPSSGVDPTAKTWAVVALIVFANLVRWTFRTNRDADNEGRS